MAVKKCCDKKMSLVNDSNHEVEKIYRCEICGNYYNKLFDDMIKNPSK